MSSVPGFQIINSLCMTTGSAIYRARALESGQAVLVKLFEPGQGGPAQSDCFRREYEIFRSLDLPGARPLALIDEPGCLAIVLQDFAGEPLEAVLGRQRLRLEECLTVARQLAGVLHTLHAAQIIHGDLRPANILLAPDRRVCLADFSLAMHEAQEVSVAPTGAGDRDWPYVSPEQTGRMNRAVDCRSDFYSFGVMMYRMFTGQLPFQAVDPLEWAHCHIARVPRPPCELAPALPSAISDIIMKLMAKVAEQRYQTAYGLQCDLGRCQAEWQAGGQIVPFKLGTEDVSGRFRIPQKLYGRESEAAAILAAFERVAVFRHAALVTVCGESGAGKSALVHELHRPVVRERGYFVAARFAPYQRDLPYVAMVDACRMLVQQMLAESETGVAMWKHQLQAGLEGQAQLLIDLIPQLELVVGPQPPVPELAPPEMQRRLQRVFRDFFTLFAAQRRPLVLFLDDAQWADTATLSLLEHLLTDPETRYLMLVIGYRANDIGPAHPLPATLQAIRQAVPAEEIQVHPLREAEVCLLLAETLHCSRNDARSLASIVTRKTNGNAFFVHQFLRTLHRDGVIVFDSGHGWSWNVQRIEEAEVTANVVDWMAGQISRLPPDVKDVLRIAACLGHQFELALLAKIAESSPARLEAPLEAALRQGLLRTVQAAEAALPGWSPIYRWSHERVQQAAYSLMEPEERLKVHLQVGRALLETPPERRLAIDIFELVRHLNLAIPLISDHSERERLAQLNLQAARRAKRATGYDVARAYASVGVDLLPSTAWQQHYTLALALHRELIEANYLCDRSARAETLLDQVLAHPHPNPERAGLLRLRLLHAAAQRVDYARSLQVGLDALGLLGVDLPATRDGWSAAIEPAFARLDAALARMSIEELLDRPPMTDTTKLAACEVLMELMSVARLVEPQLWHVLALKFIELAIEHGHCHVSAFGYASFAVLVFLRRGDIEEGYRFAALARRLLERYSHPEVEARIDVLLGGYLEFWREPLAAIIPRYKKAIVSEIEHGNLQYVGFSLLIVASRELACGVRLDRVAEGLTKAVAFARQSANDLSLRPLRRFDRLVSALRRSSDEARPDAGSIEEVVEELEGRPGDAVKYEHLAELKRLVLLGDFDDALRLVRRIGADAMTGGQIFYPMVEISFYHALTLAATCQREGSAGRDQVVSLLRQEQSRFTRWARDCPANFACFQLLLAAELARLIGDHPLALYRYEQAIAAAAQYGLPNMQGLAAERAAAACDARGAAGHAADYLEAARAAYTAWGAAAKATQIDAGLARNRDASRTSRQDVGRERLDVLAVNKASQAISGEIVLEKLLDTLMRIVIENAGAQKACLILHDAHGPYLAAEASVDAQDIAVRLPRQHDLPTSTLPQSVLNYVRRSREQVLLADAAEAHPFSADPYLQVCSPKSLLCLPILRQAELIGILYLEHRLVTHVFTADRLAVLRLLAAQAAISLENAQLYTELKDRESRIRRLVESNIIGVFFWKADGRITEANEAFLRIIGYTREEILAKKIGRDDLTSPEYRDADELAVDELRRTGTCTPYEKEFIRKDGSPVPILIGGAFIEASRETGVAFVLDLTERKQAEAERAARKVAEEANAANAAKNAFVANMSHELRSPLNAILGFARLVERRPELPAEIKEDMGIVLRSGEHLRMLINQVLDLARSQTGRALLNETSFDLHTLLRQLQDMFALKAEDKGLLLTADYGGVPHFVRTDLLKLRQVLINLLSNALKFTAQGSIALHATCHTAGTRISLGFTVADTGVGIAAQELGNLFHPFTQADAGRQTQEGTGLGLAICRSFVRLMGGDIRMESQPGRGTTVSFEIPVQLAAMERSPVSSIQPRRRVIGLAAGQPGYRILVADDRPEARQLLMRLLTPLGFSVREAANGQQAVEIWQAWRPQLIWMDVRMPVMDGCAAARAIKATPEGQATVIIALSASSFEEERADILAAGCDDFLRKPLEEDELFRLMQKHLGLRFLYDDESRALPAAAHELQAAALMALPDEVRQSLEQALIRLDSDAIAIAIAQVPDQPVARALEKLAHDFHYGEMLQMIHDAKGQS